MPEKNFKTSKNLKGAPRIICAWRDNDAGIARAQSLVGRRDLFQIQVAADGILWVALPGNAAEDFNMAPHTPLGAAYL